MTVFVAAGITNAASGVDPDDPLLSVVAKGMSSSHDFSFSVWIPSLPQKKGFLDSVWLHSSFIFHCITPVYFSKTCFMCVKILNQFAFAADLISPAPADDANKDKVAEPAFTPILGDEHGVLLYYCHSMARIFFLLGCWCLQPDWEFTFLIIYLDILDVMFSFVPKKLVIIRDISVI